MYCTVFDVRTALTPGASQSGTSGKAATAASLADWQIEDAIAEATGTVSSMLSRYAVTETEQQVITGIDVDGDPTTAPDTVAPYPVRAWTRNIAAYLATLTFKQNQDLKEDDPVRLRYIMTMGQLQAVHDGALDIPDLEPSEEVNQGVHVENTYEGQLFSPEDFLLTPEGVVPSPNVLWPLRGWR